MKIMSNLNMSLGKMSDFVSVPLFGFTLVVKPRNFNFESHWNILMFLIKNDMVSELNMSDGKMSDFVSFPLLGFTLVKKLRNFDFESHWNILFYFYFFDKERYDVRFEYFPWKNVWFCFISIVWFHFSDKTEKFRFWRSSKYCNIIW